MAAGRGPFHQSAGEPKSATRGCVTGNRDVRGGWQAGCPRTCGCCCSHGLVWSDPSEAEINLQMKKKKRKIKQPKSNGYPKYQARKQAAAGTSHRAAAKSPRGCNPPCQSRWMPAAAGSPSELRWRLGSPAGGRKQSLAISGSALAPAAVRFQAHFAGGDGPTSVLCLCLSVHPLSQTPILRRSMAAAKPAGTVVGQGEIDGCGVSAGAAALSHRLTNDLVAGSHLVGPR